MSRRKTPMPMMRNPMGPGAMGPMQPRPQLPAPRAPRPNMPTLPPQARGPNLTPGVPRGRKKGFLQ